VAARLADGPVVRLFPRPVGACEWAVSVDPARVVELGAAVTSFDGETTLALAS
jgi:hypothetical protein